MHTESSITAGSMMEAWLPVSSIRGDVKTTQSDRRSANPRVSIVVPALNEARNLEIILPRLPKVHEVIVVDGDSTDDSEAVVRAILPEAKFVRQTRRGKGNALAVGFAAVTGDIVVMFDADGSADPAEISRYVDALLAGADFAKGSRYLAGGGSADITPLRSFGNKGLSRTANLLFGTRYSDLCYGYNAFWVDILPLLQLPAISILEPQWGDGFEIETVINTRVAANDLVVTEVASYELDRIHGKSNLRTFRDGYRVLRALVSERNALRRERGQDPMRSNSVQATRKAA